MGARKPPLLLIENVPGFLSSHGGKDFFAAMKKLNDLGYAVDPFIIDAARFVPQSRQRLFVVAIQARLHDALSSPEPFLFAESEIRPRAVADFIILHPEILWSLRKLPALPKAKAVLSDILEDIPHDAPEWWNKDRTEYLFNQFSPRHLKVARGMIRESRWSYGTVFRRIRNGKSMGELRVDGLAGCLRTPRGGSGRQILFKAGFGQYHARLLTPRECARLMGADDYAITAPLNQALFGFGDAVCVPVVQWIAKYYLGPVLTQLLRSPLVDTDVQSLLA
jgi:DNA (cytosine-5)-methyltransferase 1